MDGLECRCWLDWWANPITVLASAETQITITRSGNAWSARGQLTNDEDREGFDFLCNLDPVFSLRFQDGSTITVSVHPLDNDQFDLTEYAGPTQRKIENLFEIPPPSSSTTKPQDQGVGRAHQNAKRIFTVSGDALSVEVARARRI